MLKDSRITVRLFFSCVICYNLLIYEGKIDMTQKEKTKLYAYYVNKDMRLYDDLVTYENRYQVRSTDEVDHLESIISIVRKKTFDEVMLEVFRLLDLPPFQSKKGE